MSIEFLKVRDVKSPIRDAKENGGIDFFIPEKSSFSKEELDKIGIIGDDNRIVIEPFSDVVIPAGIKSKFPNNLALIANNKSGICTKKKLIFGASVIDCSYQGEWHFHLINTSKHHQFIEFGQKIIQFIPHIIDTSEIIISDVPENEFFTEVTNRGQGGFGSTGV